MRRTHSDAEHASLRSDRLHYGVLHDKSLLIRVIECDLPARPGEGQLMASGDLHLSLASAGAEYSNLLPN